MRSAIIAAPFVAAAYAATSKQSYTLVPEISGTVTVTSTYYYSNPATKYLTETNSVGVVTGMPSNTAPTGLVTTQPAPVLTQPEVATIPAGISGTTVILLNATNGLTSFTVVGGKTTTSVLGGAATLSTVAGSSGAGGMTGGSGPHHTGGAGGASGSGTASASSTSSTGAASNVHLASGGLVGLAAFIAALL